VSWPNRPSAPFTLQVQFSVDDYRRFLSVVGKRQSNWVNFIVFIAALFSAVAVAFVFRALAARETADSVAIELAGRYSLFAYAAGVFAILVLASFMRRRAISSSLAGTPNAFDPKTIVLDNDAVSVAGALSNVRYTWPAFSQLTVSRGLLCLWIGPQNAVVVPERAFTSDEARKIAIAFIQAKIVAAKQPNRVLV
jgi:hypothetical protein